MEPLYALTVGGLVSVGVYLMLSAHLLRFLFGVMVLGNAVNLAIFTAGRITGTEPAMIVEASNAYTLEFSNALPQALMLTAIVIGFGLLAFVLGMIVTCYREFSSLDMDVIGARAKRSKAESEEA